MLNALGVRWSGVRVPIAFCSDKLFDSRDLASDPRVLLGSDSPLTAAGDLLDEIRIAHREIGVPANELYRMVFDARSADVFRLKDGQGRCVPVATADLIAVRETGVSPAETLAT